MKKILGLLAALLLSTGAHGQLLSKFGPVSGVLKGSSTTNPQTTAAGIADFQTVLSLTPGLVLNGATGGTKGAGTINATGLYVNGSAVGVGGGAVSSVGLTAPTCFGVTGSPITSAGSLGLTLTGSSTTVVRGDGTCSAIAAADINGLSPTLTGVWTFAGTSVPQVVIQPATGPAEMKLFASTGNSAYMFFTAAGAANWSLGATTGTGVFGICPNTSLTACDLSIAPSGGVTIAAPSSGVDLVANGLSGQYTASLLGSTTGNGLRIAAGSTSADVPLGIANGASSATLAAVFGDGHFTMGFNGSAATMTGSAAGAVVVTPATGVGLTVNGVANTDTVDFVGSATTGQSFGPGILAGTNSSDASLRVFNHAGTSVYFKINGDGSFVLGNNGSVQTITSNAAGALTVGPPTAGSSTATFTGNTGGGFAGVFNAQGVAGNSDGVVINAGTNSTDFPLLVRNASATVQYMAVFGDGGMTLGAPTGGDKGLGSLNVQSLFVNGSAVGVGATLNFAVCYVAVSGTTPTLVNGRGCNSVTRSGTGNYQINYTAAGFTARPNCAITAYGGAFVTFFNDPSSSTVGQFETAAVTTGSQVDPTGFMINCAGL
jgi:hypothetical protein